MPRDPGAWTAWKIRSLDVAEVIDAHRVWPKAFIVCLLFLTWKVALWYMGLDKPTVDQSGFAAAVFAAQAKALDWYMGSGRDWSKSRNGESQ